MTVLFSERLGLARCGHAGTEFLCLHQRTLGQLGAGDAGWEPEVVLDAGARAGLPTDPETLDAKSGEALRCAVEGGGESGRAAAHHDEVEAALGKALERQAEILGQPARRGTAEDGARGDDDREVHRFDAEVREDVVDFLVAIRVEPFMRDAEPREELADAQRLLGEPRADHPSGRRRAAEQDRNDARCRRPGSCRSGPTGWRSAS